MTPEEKQAIIDKALELRFKDAGNRVHILINEIGFMIFKSECNLWINPDDNWMRLKRLKSPQDLETLFNAIVS